VQSRIGYDDTFSRQGLSMVVPPLPLPQTGETYSPTQHHFQRPWIDAPLPSPCSSESADSDASSNYTTSPARTSASLYQIELPPLRSLPQSDSVAEVPLPSLKTLASPRYAAPPEISSSHGIMSRLQLPTAPNSPTQQQRPQQEEQGVRRHTSDADSSTPDRDSRMNVSALLG
jgi:Myb-like DNA-binding protein FlbD